MTSRRSFLAGILAAGVAPAAVGSGILMPVRKIVAPPATVVTGFGMDFGVDEAEYVFFVHTCTYEQIRREFGPPPKYVGHLTQL